MYLPRPIRRSRGFHSAVRFRRLAVVAVVAIAIAIGGCSHVAPYDREHLAHPAMDTAARERFEAKFHGHVYDAREAAGSSGDVAGGGCGCN